MQIHISRGEDQSGPFTLEEVREQLSQGKLQPDDLAKHEGIEASVPLSELLDAVESESVQDEGKAKAAPKKMGLLKKIIYGVLIFYTLLFAFVRFWPPPQVDIEELKTFVSEDLRDSRSGISIDSVELKLIKEVHDKVSGRGHIDFAGSFKVTNPDGSKGEIAGTVNTRYGLIWEAYWDAFMGDEVLGPRMGRFHIEWELKEVMTVERIEAETRKALRHKLDLNSQTKGAVIGSLSLQRREGNKYTGTVEITDPDGSKTKLNLHVTDHDGKIFFETKP